MGFLVSIDPEWECGAFYSFLYSDYDPDLGLLEAGAGWSPTLFRDRDTRLRLDLSMPPQGVYRIQLGAEQEVLKVLSLRLGHQWELRDNLIEGFRGFSGGFGVRFGNWGLDYAFLPEGDLGASHVAGLTYRFPAKGQDPIDFSPPETLGPQDRIERVQMDFSLSDPDPSASPIPPGTREALDALNARIQTDPRDAGAWNEMGLLYWRAGHKDYALQCFEEVLRLRPGDGTLRRWLEGQRGEAPQGPGE
jgi:tetratricopeptide (TPR) repeat protein